MLQPSPQLVCIRRRSLLLCVQAVVMKVSTANSGLCGHLTELSPEEEGLADNIHPDHRRQYATYGAVDASIVGEERAK